MQGITDEGRGSSPHSLSLPQKFYGVDFSGAAAAGKKIWITGGIRKNDRLHLQSCLRASGLSGSGNERDRCMTALLAFIRKEKTNAFGFDFPFGLPRDLAKGDGWRDFVLSFTFHTKARPEGDALDSIIATFATFRALRNQAVTAVFDHKTYLPEGYIYV